MHKFGTTLGLLVALALAAPAHAEPARDFCPDRPGLGTPACTIDDGQIAVELGLADWTQDGGATNSSDTITAGDLLLRYGISQNLEVQWGWSLYGHVRSRAGNVRMADSSTGDMRIALRQNLQNPDGSGLAIAIMPYVSLPTGGSAIGAGDWGAGIIVPVSRELLGGYAVGLTGEVAASPDADGAGRHLSYAMVAGLDVPLAEQLGATFELSAARDHDPAGASTQWLGGISLGWSPRPSLQLDVGVNLGLNRQAPDSAVYAGIAYRF